MFLLVVGISGTASAAEYNLELVRVSVGSSNGASSAAVLDGTNFRYDDSAGTITQISAMTTAEFRIGPSTALFNHAFSGVVFDLPGTAIIGSTYECIEGTFGSAVGAFLCGNTSFGANFVNETTVDYSVIPGVRVIGGDDTPSGLAQQLSDYAAWLVNFNGSTLLIESLAWTGNPGRAGIQMEFATIVAGPLADVPAITGLPQATAEASIVAADLAVGTVSTANHPSMPAGHVISQNPSPCLTCVQAGQPVHFVVSLGPITGGSVSEQIEGLIDSVEALELRKGLTNSLTKKLEGALAMLGGGHSNRDGRPNRGGDSDSSSDSDSDSGGDSDSDSNGPRRAGSAEKKLRAFVRQVKAKSGRKIPVEDANYLVMTAENLIDRILLSHSEVPPDGLKSFISQGEERTYYLEMPEDYSPITQPKPLLFMFHGTNGTHERFLPGGLYAEEGEDLRAVVGNDAIMVLPNALPNQNGTFQWDRNYDFVFVEDLLDELRRQLVFDENRLFATGHSSGAGFSHELGCRLGDIFRGVSPSAGALLSTTCTGSVAVMHVQSVNDHVVETGITEPTRNFWVLYNGFDADVFGPGVTDPCIDYSSGDSLYPVQWCLHDDTGRGGHQWWTRAGAMWDFFATLPIVDPTPDHPPGGGNDRVEQEGSTKLSFTLEYPSTIGEVYQLAAVIYPAGTQQPVFVGPDWFLNVDIDPGAAVPGTQESYEVTAQVFQPSPEMPLPGTYSISITAYVVGGGFPTPIRGVDYMVFRDVEIIDRTTPIVIDEPLVLEVRR